MSLSDNMDTENRKRKKRKKRHRHDDDDDDRTLVENVSEHEISTLDDTLNFEQPNLEGSARKKKKKRHRSLDTEGLNMISAYDTQTKEGHRPQEETGEPEEPTEFNLKKQKSLKKEKKKGKINQINVETSKGISDVGYCITDAKGVSEEASLENIEVQDSVRKKKKKCRSLNLESSNNGSECDNHVSEGYDQQQIGDPEDPSEFDSINQKSHKKNKKKRNIDLAIKETSKASEGISDVGYCLPDAKVVSEEEHDSVRKKKKKHRSLHLETSINVSACDNHAKEGYDQQETVDPEDPSEFDSMNQKSHKKNKKKRKIDPAFEETSKATEGISDVDYCLPDAKFVSDEASLENIEEHDSVRKKKKKHRSLNMEPSNNVSACDNHVGESYDQQETGDQEDQGMFDSTNQKSHKKNKKKRKTDQAIEETSKATEGISDVDYCLPGAKGSHEAASLENIGEHDSVRKKKKKSGSLNLDTSIYVSSYDNHVKEGYDRQETGDLEDPSEFDSTNQKSRKKKKRKIDLDIEETSKATEGTSDVSYYLPDEKGVSEEACLENIEEHDSVRKKKKKRRSLNSETSNNVSACDNHVKGGYDQQETGDPEDPSEFDSTNQKSHKKKRKMDPAIVGTSDATELIPALERASQENIDEQDSVRKKKKKKHRPEDTGNLEGTLVEVVQPPTCEVENDTGKALKKPGKKIKTLEVGPLLGTEGSASKKAENKNLEGGKKKNKDLMKENESQTESSMSSRLKQEMASSKADDERTAEDGNVSIEGILESITERTDPETGDDTETPAKSNESAELGRSKRLLNHLVTNKEGSCATASDNSKKESRMSPFARERREVATCKILNAMRKRDATLLEEYFPKLKFMAASTIKDLVSNELARIREAKLNGVVYKFGPFDEEEDDVLKENVNAFLNVTGLDSAEMLFHSYRFPELKATIDKLKKQYNFAQRIARGLLRPIKDVCGRGYKLFDLSGKKGRFSPEEVENLQKQLAVHGNKWCVIANLIGRDRKTSQLKASQLRRELTPGKWSTEEVNRLIQAVKEIALSFCQGEKDKGQEPVTISKEYVLRGIPWTQIEEKVQTRNWSHCKSKWNDLMLMRMNDDISPFDGLVGMQTNIKIIKWLYENDTPDGQVNWYELGNVIGNVPAGIIQEKVYKMKARYVPDWQQLSFREIVESLHEVALPIMENKFNSVTSRKGFPVAPERKEEFLVADIFREYTDYERDTQLIRKVTRNR